jgi:thioesterase domain-containing protein
VQSTGPYSLVGNSGGGVLALEIARQLRAAGHEIALLAAFDSHLTGTRVDPGDPRHWPMEPPKTTAHRVRRWLWMRWAMQRYHASQIRARLRFAKLQVRWWLDQRVHGAVPERGRGVYAAYHGVRATENYRPAPFEGRVALFRCTRSPGPRDLGWGAIAGGGLEIHEVDSTHDELLFEPQVCELASKLAPLIREAWDRSSRQPNNARVRV